MTKRNEQTETAAEAYTRLSVDIKAQIKNLEFRLQIHEGSHRDCPTNWGYVGDLGHVKELLGEILEFMNSGASRKYPGNPAAEGAAAARRDDEARQKTPKGQRTRVTIPEKG